MATIPSSITPQNMQQILHTQIGSSNAKMNTNTNIGISSKSNIDNVLNVEGNITQPTLYSIGSLLFTCKQCKNKTVYFLIDNNECAFCTNSKLIEPQDRKLLINLYNLSINKPALSKIPTWLKNEKFVDYDYEKISAWVDKMEFEQLKNA
jgi:hypothetical protein